MASLERYGFVATEYHSQGGHGATMLRRTSRGWVASVWRDRGRGYVPVTEPCESVDKALAAYAAWMQRPADNDVAF